MDWWYRRIDLLPDMPALCAGWVMTVVGAIPTWSPAVDFNAKTGHPHGDAPTVIMKYDPDIHHRRSIRLREFDYSANGAYFVTICTQGRECLLGDIADGVMRVNDAGRMINVWWNKLPDKFRVVETDKSIIMPNHFHGIISIVGAPPRGCPDLSPPYYRPDGRTTGNDGRTHGAGTGGRPHGAAPTLGDLMDWFKTMTTNAYIHGVEQSGWTPFPGRLWQRNYYERIIRNDAELAATREYITYNPKKWAQDEENPAT
jgi:putative transposase